MSGPDLDPLLLTKQRMFILCMLADMESHEFSLLCKRFDQTAAAISEQIRELRTAEYVRVQWGVNGDLRRMSVRLTRLGRIRLVSHVLALQGIVQKACDLMGPAAADLAGCRVGGMGAEELEK
ncbi:transcriptional regulator [Amycolatopsis sp. cg5]|uniref:transcriptional regulator n=1 Tax=Amycolatopsis sp. cg5 TaxID=3238802 RepID=UPI003525DFBF